MDAVTYLNGLDLSSVQSACFVLGAVGVSVALAYAGAATVRKLVQQLVHGLGR